MVPVEAVTGSALSWFAAMAAFAFTAFIAIMV